MTRRMTVHDAARSLGISEDAVRMRVKRDTLEAERENGKLYVLLEDEPTAEPTELVEELRNQVQDLRTRLDKETEANRENRRLLAAALERIPELTERTPDSRETAAEPPGRGPVPDEPETGTQRPWWRRMFGG